MNKEVTVERVQAAMRGLHMPVLEPVTRESAISVMTRMEIANPIERAVWSNQQTFTIEDIAYLARLDFIVEGCSVCGYQLWHAAGVSEEEIERRIQDDHHIIGGDVLCGSCSNQMARRAA